MEECKNRAPGSLEWKEGEMAEREKFENMLFDKFPHINGHGKAIAEWAWQAALSDNAPIVGRIPSLEEMRELLSAAPTPPAVVVPDRHEYDEYGYLHVIKAKQVYKYKTPEECPELPTPPEVDLKKVVRGFIDWFDTEGDIDTMPSQIDKLRDAVDEEESDD